MTAARPRYRGSGRAGEPVERNPGAAERIPRSTRPESLRMKLSAAAWLAAWELIRRVPEPLTFALADLGGRAAHRFATGARQRVAANLRRVTGPDDLDRAVHAAFRSYARYWVESFRAADLDSADLDARTTVVGFDQVDQAFDEGRGVVVLLAHHGSWDVAAQWAETHGYHLAVVAEVVRPRRLFERFVRLREAVGLEVVPLQRSSTAGAAAALTQRLSTVLAANHMVGLLSDRDLSGKGPAVDFFGAPACIPRGPAVLAARTGAAVIPITMLQRPGRRWHLEARPPLALDGLDVNAATARIGAALEDLIRLDPVQWHCFSRIWVADRRDSQ